MLVGYARVSANDQNLDRKLDALKVVGCERLFTDTASGAKTARPGLTAALKECRAGDTFVVWKLDRLGRSLPHLVETVRDLMARGSGFKSLQGNIDTTTAGGKLIFHLFAALAEFERDLIRERTNAGLSAARARGRKGGRPKGVMDERKQKAALALKNDPILLANQLLGRGKSSEARSTCLGLRDLVKPGDNAIKIDGGCGGDVLKARLGKSAVTTKPQPKGPYPLRNRPLNARPSLIELLTFR